VPEPAGSYETRVREVRQNMLGIVRCAFQSDLTRVASFTCGNGTFDRSCWAKYRFSRAVFISTNDDRIQASNRSALEVISVARYTPTVTCIYQQI
jgi:hypothetical protein